MRRRTRRQVGFRLSGRIMRRGTTVNVLVKSKVKWMQARGKVRIRVKVGHWVKVGVHIARTFFVR